MGVWQSLKEVGKAASFTGRATMSSITGSSSSQQKPSQSVQLLHCRGDSHSTMTSSSQLCSSKRLAKKNTGSRAPDSSGLQSIPRRAAAAEAAVAEAPDGEAATKPAHDLQTFSNIQRPGSAPGAKGSLAEKLRRSGGKIQP